MFGSDLIGSLAFICPAFECALIWTLAKMVSAARVPNTYATFKGPWILRNVTRLGSIDHTIYSFLASSRISQHGSNYILLTVTN